jgi:hypothetical protein
VDSVGVEESSEEIVGGRDQMIMAVGIMHREAITVRVCSTETRGGMMAAAWVVAI